MRWKESRDAAVLVTIIHEKFAGKVPRSAADVKGLGALMPGAIDGYVWDAGKLRKRAVEIQKKGESGLTL